MATVRLPKSDPPVVVPLGHGPAVDRDASTPKVDAAPPVRLSGGVRARLARLGRRLLGL